MYLKDTPTMFLMLYLCWFRCVDHPLRQELVGYQKRVLDRLRRMVEKHAGEVASITVPLPPHMRARLATMGVDTGQDRGAADTDKGDTGGTDCGVGTLSESVGTAIDDDDVVVAKGKRNVSEDKVVDKCEKPESETNKIDTSHEIDTSDSASDLSQICDTKDTVPDIADTTASIKRDICSAIDAGNREQSRLRQQTEAARQLVKQVTTDYDRYNQENMDDLFDSDTEEQGTDVGEETETGGSTGVQRRNISSSSEQCQPLDTREDCLSGETAETNEESVNVPTKTRSEDTTAERAGSSVPDVERKISKLRDEAYNRHLKDITEDIITYLERIQVWQSLYSIYWEIISFYTKFHGLMMMVMFVDT